MKSKIKLMALSCAIFFVSCSSEPESTVEPITIVDHCSYLPINSIGEVNKIEITLVLLLLIQNLMALIFPLS
jgi:hypothetical protein